MKNIIKLVKINILSFMPLRQIKNYKDYRAMIKPLVMSVLMILAYLYLVFYIFLIGDFLMSGFQSLNAAYLLPTQFMIVASSFILFSTIYKVKSILFETKDYDFLMSLPINKNTIIISKLIILYIYNLVFSLLIMIPAFIIYIKYIPISILLIMYYFITLLIIPLIPMIIATFIGTLFSYIGSFFKKKNLIDIIFSLIFIAIALYFQTKMSSMSQIDLANIGQSIVNKFNHIYPLTNVYINIIKDYNLISLLIFISIPLILFIIYIKIVEHLFIFIHYNLTNRQINYNYKLNDLKTNSSIKSLYYKELKRYFSSSIYVLNTSIMVIILTGLSIGLIFFGTDKIDKFIGYPNFSNMLNTITPLIISLFSMMTCTTCSSISMEGKNLWIVKHLPISPMSIFYSKILVNLTITIPAIIINSVILGLYLNLGLINIILSIIIPLLYSLLSASLGILINLLFPLLKWDNEIRVVKQSLSSILGILINSVIGVTSIAIIIKFNQKDILLILTIMGNVVLLMILITFYLLKTIGQKIFNKIN